jgi:hypothetical protein
VWVWANEVEGRFYVRFIVMSASGFGSVTFPVIHQWFGIDVDVDSGLVAGVLLVSHEA